MFNVSGKATDVQIESFNPFQSGNRTNLIEEIQQPVQVNAGTVNLEIGKHAIETIMVQYERLRKN